MIGETYFSLRAQLGTALFSLQTLASDLNAAPDTLATLQQLQQSLREPFIFVVLGEAKTGKSTLVNAIFGREFCTVDGLSASDQILVFKYGDEERIEQASSGVVECYRAAPFLRDFNIIETSVKRFVAVGESATGQILSSADLVLFVFSAIHPWAATAWGILRQISKRQVTPVAFVLQQTDLRSADEIATISKHFEQTMLERFGRTLPIFPVSAKPALAATISGHALRETLVATGCDKLETFINSEIALSEPRLAKLRKVCETAHLLLGDLGERAQEAMETVEREAETIVQIDHALADRKEQSLRQIGGVLWSLAQSYEKAQKRGEELLSDRLTLVSTAKLLLKMSDWRPDFQRQLEERLCGALEQQVENSRKLLEADLRSVGAQLHDSIETAFGGRQDIAGFPEIGEQPDLLVPPVDLELLDHGTGLKVHQQLDKLFAETGTSLRVAAVIAAGGVLFWLIATFTRFVPPDVSSTIALVTALTAIAVALFERRQLLRAFRKQMLQKRESLLSGIEDHLRQTVEKFFAELATTFAPFHSFSVSQRKLHTPMLTRIQQLNDLFSKSAADLASPPRAPLS